MSLCEAEICLSALDCLLMNAYLRTKKFTLRKIGYQTHERRKI
jgi:hypothetical protein